MAVWGWTKVGRQLCGAGRGKIGERIRENCILHRKVGGRKIGN